VVALPGHRCWATAQSKAQKTRSSKGDGPPADATDKAVLDELCDSGAGLLAHSTGLGASDRIVDFGNIIQQLPDTYRL
jgi:hypothetical protein